MKTKMTKKLEKEIIAYLDGERPEVFWDCREGLSSDQVSKILETEDGLFALQDELWEYNLDYICEIENQVAEKIIAEFDIESWDSWDIRDHFLDYIHIDLGFDNLLNNTGDITALVVMYSNYDCCNSFDDPKEPETYLTDVYSRVKTGVKRADCEYEFYNGAYGGSLFCFAFKGSIQNIIELKKATQNGATHIGIPKGTQYGFFSSFQGAGSVFEKITHRNMKVKINGETEHDTVDIMADCQQSHSMADVYGDTRFIDNSNITVT